MPKIQLTVFEGALTADGREHVQAVLAAVLMRWEDAPDPVVVRDLPR